MQVIASTSPQEEIKISKPLTSFGDLRIAELSPDYFGKNYFKKFL